MGDNRLTRWNGDRSAGSGHAGDVALTVALPVLTAVITPLLFTVRTPIAAGPVGDRAGDRHTGSLRKFAGSRSLLGLSGNHASLVTETSTDVGVRFVTTTPGPAIALSAIYRGETAPSQIRNS